MFYFSGDNTQQIPNEVAFVIIKETEKSVKEFIITDRIAILNAMPCNVNIIAAYVSTFNRTKDDVDNIYSQLSKTIDELKKEDINIYLGNFNSKLGKGTDGEVVSEHGLGTRNQRGERTLGINW